MTAFVFHQNLRKFGGRGKPKNEGLITVLQKAALELETRQMGFGSLEDGPNRVLVAGFTEVMNDGNAKTALENAIPELRSTIGNGLLIACGYTALTTSAKAEFIAIGWDETLQVQYCGQVLLNSSQQWTCTYHPYPDPHRPWESIPPDTVPDVRGLTFIAGTLEGVPILVGFVHNTYTIGNSNLLTGGMPKIATAIGTALAGTPYADAHTLVGGDWNVPPRDMSPFKGYWLKGANGANVLTTSANTYDFWEFRPSPQSQAQFTNDQLKVLDYAQTTVYTKVAKSKTDMSMQTEVQVSVSDHSAISISVA